MRALLSPSDSATEVLKGALVWRRISGPFGNRVAAMVPRDGDYGIQYEQHDAINGPAHAGGPLARLPCRPVLRPVAHFADRLSSCVLHIFVFACIRKFMKNDPSGQDAKRLFRALSAESRQQILRLVADRWLCVGALSNRLGMSAGAMSQHLRILKDAGLVDSDRRGTFIHYRATPDAADRCREAIETVFGESGGEGPECRGSEGECQ